MEFKQEAVRQVEAGKLNHPGFRRVSGLNANVFYHAPSGLYLTHYRAYDPKTARWLSRDPIEEEGGINLYTYVLGNLGSYTQYFDSSLYTAS